MKRIYSMGCALCAVIVLSALGVASASAALPELGRCQKLTPTEEGKKKTYHGMYSSKSCTHIQASGKGKFEWTPGPGTNNKFFASTGNEPVLETVGGVKVECAIAAVHGEYTGAKTEKLTTVVLSGCQLAAGKTCQSNPAKEGEIEAKELEGELGVIKGPPKEIAGWDIKKSGVIAAFTCGKPPEVASVDTIEGSVIGAVTGGYYGNLNRMSIYSTTRFKQVGGKQQPEMFEGAAKDTLTTKAVIGLSTTTEQTGLTATLQAESGLGEPIEKEANQEPLEIRTKPEEA